MKYSFVVRSKAAKDMASATRWYEKKRPGLGDEFIQEVLETFDIILRNPLAALARNRNTRRVAVKRFPYGVFYRVIGSEIRVIAVYHDKRDPSGWVKRN